MWNEFEIYIRAHMSLINQFCMLISFVVYVFLISSIALRESENK